MMRRNFTSILFFALTFCIPYSILLGSEFAGGNGTQKNPYRIETPRHLNNVRNHLDKYFRQQNNIDLSNYHDGKGWHPIGSMEDPFSGYYDGNGFKITHLYINRPETLDVGLFGYVDNATLKNVFLENVSVRGEEVVGSLAGVLLDSEVYRSYAAGNVTGEYNQVGGLVGRNSGGSISASYAAAAVSGRDDVGGLVGRNEGFLSKSYAAGDVHGENYIGGLAGINHTQTGFGQIQDCFSVGKVSGTEIAGGLVGGNYSMVSRSYYDYVTAGQNDDEGKGKPKSTKAMMQKATFTGWNFEDYWDIMEEKTYPFLQWQQLDVDFTSDPTKGLAPLEVVFSDMSQGNMDTWEWIFDYDNNDDETDSFEQNPTYIFTEPGIYSVQLTVTGGTKKHSVIREIEVYYKTSVFSSTWKLLQ